MQRALFAALAWASLSLGSNFLAAKAPAAINDFADKLASFDEVLEEIRKAQESGDWKKAGWKPKATTNWLDYLLAEVKRATKRDKLRLPVTFDQVKPAAVEQALATQQGALHVIKDGRLSFARQSIILADGSVDLSLAEGCIIIARGAVTISSSQRNLIVAGQFVGVSSDRPNSIRFAPAPVAPNGAAPAAPAPDSSDTSVILSGGILDISSAYGTICCGLERLIVSYTNQGAIVLNSPQREVGTSAQYETLDAPQVPFTRKAARNPLDTKLDITQVVPGTTTGLAVVQRGGVEYVLRQGAAITDERGQPVVGLENWRLDFLGRNYALFVKDRQYAGFYVKR